MGLNFYKNKTLGVKNKYINSTENVKGNFESMVMRATRPATSAFIEQDYHIWTASSVMKQPQHKAIQ